MAVLFLFFGLGLGNGATFDVRQFGARGDGHTFDSLAIQETLDACARAGGGVVTFAAGVYLSKPLFLHGNNLTLQFDSGAVLLGTPQFADYRKRFSSRDVVGLINADGLTNLSIVGAGAIDGSGAPWWPEVKLAKKTGQPEPRRRPKMVNLQRCRGVVVRGVTLRNSPSFHLVPTDCEDVLIDNVTIVAPGDSPNTDAIDPGACRHVRIINCLLDVGDDNVAVKAGHPVEGRPFCCEDIVVSNCICRHGHGISIGSETTGGVSNFVVIHCSFDGTVSGLRIKSARGKGGRVEDIRCTDITMNGVRRPIDIACYYPKIPVANQKEPLSPLTPNYSDIRIEHVTGECPDSAGLIVGLPESPVRNVVLSHVHLKCRTGLLVRNAENVRLEDTRFDVQEGKAVIIQNATVLGP